MNKLESIKKACSITDQIFSKIIKNFNFKTEKQLANCINKEIRKNKLKKAFPTIVASGKNSSEIHHKPVNKKLRGFTVMDFGVKVNGYCSDMTRTIFVGKPTKSQINLYNKLLRVQEDSIKRTKSKIKYSDLDIKARNCLKKHKKYFLHALGHGVGKKIHQNPRISPKSTHISKPRDIITIEPGIYFRNKFGIRIEDTVLVKKNKSEPLTKSTKKLITI